MQDSAELFVVLGATLLVGLGADALARRTGLPRVTLLLLLGFLIGPTGFDLLPESREALFRLFASIALTMVGFLLGERLGGFFRGGGGREVLIISFAAVLVTAAIVFGGLLLLGLDPVFALLLAAIAPATDPAATMDVVRQAKAKGPFTRTLLGVVAVDDAWGLLLFSFVLAGAQAMQGGGDGAALEPVLTGLREIGGAAALGLVLGLAMAYLTGRIAKGEPTLVEAVGFVLLTCGLALVLEVSLILTAMVMGTMVSLFARHHLRPFHAIEHIELPFMMIFFVLAGASLELEAMAAIGFAGLGYIILRAAGRLAGGALGGALAHSHPVTRRWMGPALMPQAGVALGMALLAADRVPEFGSTLLQIAIGSTVFFELAGPFMTRIALRRSGETGA